MIKKISFSTAILINILILAFVFRFYKIENPVADWHSWRQADTAAVARNFYQEGFTPMYPKGDDMSTISEVLKPNLLRLRFVEFPIYPAIVYFGYLLNQGVDERVARFVSILFSLGSLIFLYLIAKRFFGQLTATFAALIFAVLPFSVYYSRVILPEPSLVFFCLGMFYFVEKWIFGNSFKFYLLSVFFTICAFLTKPMAILYLPPLIYLIFCKEGKLFFNPLRYLLWIIPSILPFGFWRMWINQYPEGIPASSWLFNGVDTSGKGIRFRPAFFRWIVGDRFSREILSPIGLAIFLFGAFIKPFPKETFAMHILLLSSLLYLIVFARGNVQHDYYQVIILPILVIFTARGFSFLVKGLPLFFPRIITIPLAVFLFGLIYILSWNEVAGLYQINNPVIVEAGKRADQLLPKDAIVVAPYGGDTAFLYQINRSGFPFVDSTIPEMIEKYKVTALVSTAKDADTSAAMKRYRVIEETSGYVIVDLTQENTSSSEGN